jgi:hypothetical protein
VAGIAFKHFADGFGRAFFGQEPAGLIAQHFLIVREVEIHGVSCSVMLDYLSAPR